MIKMMKKLFVTIVVVGIATMAIAQQKGFKRIQLANNTVSIDLPKSFGDPENMDGTDSLPKAESWAIVDKNPRISLTYSHNCQGCSGWTFTDEDIPKWADIRLADLQKDPRYRYIDDGIFLQGGKNISYIKYSVVQQGIPDSYVLLFFTNLNDQLIQFQFTSPLKLRKKWEAIADAIANSIIIAETF